MTTEPTDTRARDEDERLLTPDEVAQRLRVTAEQVRSLIRTGQLIAVNVGAGRKRPCYRVTPAALHEFLGGRRTEKPAPATRRSKPLPPVADFFPDLP